MRVTDDHGTGALDHVQIAAPPGGEPQARAFFGELLGFAEIPKPETMRADGGVWFALTGSELHIGIEEHFAPARKAHPAVRVSAAEFDAPAERLGPRASRCGGTSASRARAGSTPRIRSETGSSCSVASEGRALRSRRGAICRKTDARQSKRGKSRWRGAICRKSHGVRRSGRALWPGRRVGRSAALPTYRPDARRPPGRKRSGGPATPRPYDLFWSSGASRSPLPRYFGPVYGPGFGRGLPPGKARRMIVRCTIQSCW